MCKNYWNCFKELVNISQSSNKPPRQTRASELTTATMPRRHKHVNQNVAQPNQTCFIIAQCNNYNTATKRKKIKWKA